MTFWMPFGWSVAKNCSLGPLGMKLFPEEECAGMVKQGCGAKMGLVAGMLNFKESGGSYVISCFL
jgi:hypothetical protein